MHYNSLTLCMVLITIQFEVPVLFKLKKKKGSTHISMHLQIHLSQGFIIFWINPFQTSVNAFIKTKYLPLRPYAAVNVHCIQGGFTKQMLQHTNNFFFYTFSTLVSCRYILDVYYSLHMSKQSFQCLCQVSITTCWLFCYFFVKLITLYTQN